MGQTITEALAEIKTLDKRIIKKREFIIAYMVRQERFKDPLPEEGGSVTAIKRELQATSDLEQRKVNLRLAINRANEDTTLSIDGTSKSIAAWLVWRRDVSPGYQRFLGQLRQGIDTARRTAQQKGLNVVAGDVKASDDTDVIINLNEQELAKEAEHLEMVLGDLDGQLSLKNATTTIDL